MKCVKLHLLLYLSVKKLVVFQQHVIGLHKFNFYFTSHIGGVIENPFNFNILSDYTVNYIGEN